MIRLLITCRDIYGEYETIKSLKRVVEGIKVKRTGFRAVLIAEVEEGDPIKIAEKVNRECSPDIGKVVLILEDVESNFENVKEAAVKVGLSQISEGESFCFRIYKRGSHYLDKPTPELEYEIGGTIYEELEEKFKKKPVVDLKDSDITIVAEVLGKRAEVGIIRKKWSEETN